VDLGSLEAEREEEVDDGGGKALLDQGEDFWAVGVLFEDSKLGWRAAAVMVGAFATVCQGIYGKL